jgi:hypothetical protein
MDHDFYGERPQQRDIFIPAREAIGEEIYYLLRTGIIILLNGAPTIILALREI